MISPSLSWFDMIISARMTGVTIKWLTVVSRHYCGGMLSDAAGGGCLERGVLRFQQVRLRLIF